MVMLSGQEMSLMTTCSILETGRILEILLSFFSYIVWEVYYVLDLESEQKNKKFPPPPSSK